MPHSALVDYLQTRMGDALRGVVRYHDESVDLLYLRDDVRAARMQNARMRSVLSSTHFSIR